MSETVEACTVYVVCRLDRGEIIGIEGVYTSEADALQFMYAAPKETWSGADRVALLHKPLRVSADNLTLASLLKLST